MQPRPYGQLRRPSPALFSLSGSRHPKPQLTGNSANRRLSKRRTQLKGNSTKDTLSCPADLLFVGALLVNVDDGGIVGGGWHGGRLD